MSTTAPGPADHLEPSRAPHPGPEPVGDPRIHAALRQLVVDGVLAEHQARLTAAALAAALAPAPAPTSPADVAAPGAAAQAPLRARLAEVAGYAGGALVATGIGLFLGSAWPDLSRAARVAWLAGIAVVLLLAGAAVLATARLPLARLLPELRAGGLPVRRRLTSALWSLAGLGVGAAVAVGLEPGTPFPAALAALPVLAAGYAVAPAVVGHAAVFAAFALASASALDQAGVVDRPIPYALVLLAVAAAWAVLTLTGVLRERVLGLALATGIAFAGVMVPAGQDPWVSHGLGIALAALLFAGYVRLRADRCWPLLAGAVLATTVVAAQVTDDLLGGRTSRGRRTLRDREGLMAGIRYQVFRITALGRVGGTYCPGASTVRHRTMTARGRPDGRHAAHPVDRSRRGRDRT
ncbi:MAG: hypothetical protein ACTHOD_20485 [Motilibacteraceae bacterium]